MPSKSTSFRAKTGRAWVASASSEVNDWEVDTYGIPNVYVKDLDFIRKPLTSGEIRRISENLNEKGVHGPIEDGLENDGQDFIEAEDAREQPARQRGGKVMGYENEDATSGGARTSWSLSAGTWRRLVGRWASHATTLERP